MEPTIAKKLRIKPGMTALVLYPPEGYPALADTQAPAEGQRADFVHLFVSSREQFEARLEAAMAQVKPGGLFWLSYPKASGKNKPDIHRDSLWDLSIPHGIHPVAQVALDETWSALRFVANVPGETYARPNKGA